MKKLLSIVVPCYNEEEATPIFYKTIHEMESELASVDLEFVFVDDGSRDNTLKVLKELHQQDERVHYVSFSRNFGKEAGIYAGLEKAKGDYVVIMDVDLQDPPSMLPKMLSEIENGEYECVSTRRVDRKGEPPIRSWFARKFYKIMNKISSADIVDGARDYQMMTRKVVNAILSMGEYNRFSKGIFGWVGFKRKWLEFENVERVAGETKWSFWKLFIYAIDGIVAFSTAPLTLASVFGSIMCLVAFLFIIVIIVRTLIFGDPTSGWPSMVCIILLVSGIQLLCLGIQGQYMAKTYLETKKRPIYLVQEEE
ncbi:glycosyltransferase family 2 protein [Pseudobutyrivibrio ruminis]|uniref:Glycosyltransferase involved in cell wall bisynthesis n=1 Tax=Pseudobutyrivibrio ruminis DSM 9787 TaxID=1123011 RepID=A0A285S9G6_9FIRM|nr:glycosyltransferase family 2 protein [Pseudobutyrivibrio ruminis]SOC04107.1 Glycosyltransferase involved in cell wall bisynthesis [Pseudobutyrivibrio ruminis DSM 9787]